MSYPGLITHGLRAIAVFAEIIGVRVMLAATAVMLLLSGGVTALVLLPEAPLLSPAVQMLLWISLIAAWQTLISATLFTFFVMQARQQATFVPLRDYGQFARFAETATATAR